MRGYHVLFVVLLTFSYGKAYGLDVYSPVGKDHSCTTEVRSLLEAAYRNYPSIKASKNLILGANALVESAKWNYFPTPSVDISQRAGRNGSTFRLDQPLWTGGGIDAMNDMALSRQNEAQYTLGESGYALAEKFLNVLQNYVQADGEIRAFKAGKKQLESLSEMLDKRMEAGVSSEADGKLLDSRISQIEADLIMAEARYEMSKSQLELLIGKPLKCAVRFKEDKLLKQTMSLRQMKESLLETHPTLKKLKAQIDIAYAEKKSTDSVIMPNISLRAEHQRGSIYQDDVESDTIAYVAVTYTPGAGFSALSNMESAQYKVLEAKDTLVTKEFELQDTLVMDYANYHSALDRTESIRSTIESSRKVLESYKRLFIAGKRQWLDLVNTSRELTQNEITLATLRAGLISSSYRLALQTGNIDFELEGSL